MFKSVLSSLIISQMILAPAVFAETKTVTAQPATKQQAAATQKIDPAQFNWEGDTQSFTTSGGTVVPAANSLLWGEVPNDPWGTKDDPTGDLGNGGLGGGTSGNWEPDIGDIMGTSINNTDTIITYFLKGSEVTAVDYATEIANLRRSYSYLNDLELANKIITDASNMAGGIGASTAAFSGIIQYLATKLGQSATSLTGTVAAAAVGAVSFLGQEYIDLSETTKIQAEMILKLAALFGETPRTEAGKIRLIYNTYIYGAATGGIVSGVSNGVASGLFKSIGGKAIQEAGEKAVTETITATVPQAATKVVNNGAIRFAVAAWLANHARTAKFLSAFKLSNKGKQVVTGLTGAAVGAGLSYALNKYITKDMGNDFYKRFFTEQFARKTYAISYVRTLPMARGTLWLLLTRDVFNRIPSIIDQKKFAQIISSEIPLVKTSRVENGKTVEYSEAAQLMKAFKADPKLIENNLTQLNHELNTEAKLYFVRLIMAGMLMKGTFDAGDEKTLNDITNILGLQPPPNGPKLNERDRRQDIVTRYYGLKKEMTSTVTNTLLILERAAKGQKLKDPRVQEKAKNAQVWGAAGTIILEDFEEVTHDLIIMNDPEVDGKQQEKSPSESAKAKQLKAEKMAEEAKTKALKKEAQKAPGLK